MEDNPLVSVITVTRNRGKLIRRCIDSVLNQTYTNIDYIIVDGASDDETDNVIKNYHDERLRFIKLESNWPIIKTFHYGVEQARGKYVTFLDSDDEYLPTKIEKQVRLIESLPEEYGMVYCWMTYYDSSKNNAVVRVHDSRLRGFVPVEAAEKPTVSGTPAFMFKKNIFKELGGWNVDSPLATDWELGARYCQRWKVDYVPESLVNVYINHCYDRTSSHMRYDKTWLAQRIAGHEYYLTEFKESFDQQIGSRWYQYKSLSFFCLKNKNVWKAVKYSCLFIINIIEHKIYERFIKPRK